MIIARRAMHALLPIIRIDDQDDLIGIRRGAVIVLIPHDDSIFSFSPRGRSMEEGEHTGNLPGRVLRNSGHQAITDKALTAETDRAGPAGPALFVSPPHARRPPAPTGKAPRF